MNFHFLSRRALARLALLSLVAGLPVAGSAQTPADPPPDPPLSLDNVVVHGRSADLLEEAAAASDGQVGAVDLADRPILRRGELLEVVPGLVVTQHSGSGKANQYFLRGFNLDHGTDFAVSVDGLPVNMRTHAHGQGYSDLNFIIPELIAGVTYQKGQYSAANGDFSAAGAAQFHLVDALPQDLALVEAGADDYFRMVAAGTRRSAAGAATTVGVELGYSNGPWLAPEHSRRFNLFVRQTWSRGTNDFALTLLGYRGAWDATDQIPARAVAGGALDRFGTIDPTDGGDSDRASLAFDWTAHGDSGATRLNAYVLRYRLNLFSNFSYFLNDPINGDQFNQRDDRTIVGGSLAHTWTREAAAHKVEFTVGAQSRTDFIEVGLFHTRDRTLLSAARDDNVSESSTALYAEGIFHVTPEFRVVAGLRADGYLFDVGSDLPANSGRRTATIASPKLSLVFAPGRKTALYLNLGSGFHSNDARGTVIRVDPESGAPADRVDPLVRAKSAELGLRTALVPGLVSTVSLWAIDLGSELVFVGDAGATEASGATRRYGLEWANYYRPAPWVALDADFALTHGRYRDKPAGEDRIANSIGTVLTAGATIGRTKGVFGTVRLRYFGPQPLIEDDSVQAAGAATLNLRAGWRSRNWEIALDVLNALDRANPDISYFYPSRLPDEPAEGVDDIHFHPAEPRTIRATFTRRF